MNDRNNEIEIPLRIAIVTNNPSYFLPVLDEHNCRVFEFKREEVNKAVETINIYKNQQVFDAVFIDYCPGVR